MIRAKALSAVCFLPIPGPGCSKLIKITHGLCEICIQLKR